MQFYYHYRLVYDTTSVELEASVDVFLTFDFFVCI